MAKIKNKLLIVLASVMLLALSLFALSACGGSSDYTVTFMVRENGTTGKWQQYTTATTNDDGSVTLPAAPTVEGYTFRDWYTDEACTDVFDETSVTVNITVYALMAENEVVLNVTDGEGNTTTLESGSFAALSETTAEQEGAALSENLTFDGWYTDTAFTQKYSSGMDATALYGRYMAKLTYDNGYEELYTELVTPGNKTTAPDARVENFVKRYMDDEDISYQDAEGNAIDFANDAFDTNSTVTVLWKTPGLQYEKIAGTENDYYVSNFDFKGDLSYPAVSVLSQNVTMEDGSKGNVVAVNTLFDFARFEQAEVFIFNDGIEYIKEFFSGMEVALGGSSMKMVCLPTTLKVLESSFNMANSKLTSLTLYEGLEVIIDCFWGDTFIFEGTYRENAINCDIVIPSTVNNMVAVPKTLDISNNDNFEYDEDGRLYYVAGNSKILCSEYQSNVTDDGRLVVEEGVTGVQVYLLSTMDFDYLDLPSTFTEVGYNNEAEDYPAYTGNLLTPQAVINDPTAVPPEGTNKNSYAIVSDLEDLTYVTIAQTSFPASVSDYAFVSTSGVPYNGSEFANDAKVVLIGNVAEGEAVEIRLTVSYSRDNEVTTTVLNSYKSGDALTVANILEAAGVSEEDYTVIIRNVGAVYEGGTITSDMYITVECYAKAGGFTYTVNADGKTATVTGYDQLSAEQLTDGSYRITIDMIDGYEVSAIADGAFKNVGAISEVYIANTVITIGAEAFMNMSNLRLVDIAPGGLKVIGKSAFENAGCVQDAEGNWSINTDGGVTELKMVLPLADITEIQPYAFKTKSIKTFTPVEGEEKRHIVNGLADVVTGSYVPDNLVEGEFYWAWSITNSYFEIVQYVKQGTEQASDGENITMIDVRLIAIAGGDTTTGFTVNIGFSLRAASYASYFPALKTASVRFEVMEGSVYFTSLPIEFGVVSKVHKNAFTDMNDNRIYWYGPEGDTWISQTDLQNQNSEIFVDGWWEGIPNNELTITENAESDSNTILGQ